MPLELAVWRVDGDLRAIPLVDLDLEARLGDLCVAREGHSVVLDCRRDSAPRASSVHASEPAGASSGLRSRAGG
jgi:hypothetical protein